MKRSNLDDLNMQINEIYSREMSTIINQEMVFSSPDWALGTWFDEVLKDKEVSARAVEPYRGIEVQDLYGVFVGLLYLLDSGNDLPWLYFPALSVATMAVVRLPWYKFNVNYSDEQKAD